MVRKLLLVASTLIAVALTVNAQQPDGRAVHVTLHEGTSMAAALSPDGRTIAIDLLGTLWTMPASGGVAKPITDIAMDARQPSWSPDGTRLAFQAYRSTTWQIWTMNADGSDLRAVTSGPYDDREPSWSPDGRRIAFSSDRSGSYDVWVLALATGDITQVTADPSNEFHPSWRRASNEIAFVSDRREKPGVYAVAASASGSNATERLVAASEGAVAGPAFASDGSSIAFTVLAGGRTRLMIGDRNIADPDEDVFPFRPQWASPNEVLYTADGRIKRRPAAGGAAKVVEFTADVSFTRPAFTPKPRTFDLSKPQPVRGIMHPAVSPDGTQVAFAAVGDLWIDPSSRSVSIAGKVLTVTAIEYDILLSLARSAGRVKTREQLLLEATERDFEVFDRSIDVHVSSLRKKLGDDPRNPRYIETVRSVGYRMKKPADC